MLAPAILLALAANASASRLPDCIHVSTTSAELRSDLDSVRDCQQKARQRMIDRAEAKGTPLTGEQLDAIDDRQRAEVRTFLEKTELTQTGAPLAEEPPPGAAPPAPDGKRVPDVTASDAAAVLKLRKKLAGRKTLGAETTRDVMDALSAQQGGASADMKALLDSTSGGSATPETVKKLKDAAAASRGRGMDLQLDPETQKGLEDAQRRLASPPDIDKR